MGSNHEVLNLASEIQGIHSPEQLDEYRVIILAYIYEETSLPGVGEVHKEYQEMVRERYRQLFKKGLSSAIGMEEGEALRFISYVDHLGDLKQLLLKDLVYHLNPQVELEDLDSHKMILERKLQLAIFIHKTKVRLGSVPNDFFYHHQERGTIDMNRTELLENCLLGRIDFSRLYTEDQLEV